MSRDGADQTDPSELKSKDAVTGLSIRDLVVQFPGQAPVLLDFSLDVLPGQIIALVGASGCGKSTLLRTVAGLQSYSCGRIEFTGAPNSRRGDLSFVFQDATLLPWRTA
jgi:NitT/TauT family transport system ATP-binding protein